jgi:peroxiredoxin
MADTRWTVDPDIDAYLETMELPPASFMQQLAAARAPIEAAAPKVGEPAPAFTAQYLSASGELTGESVSLADFHGRPLALLFGNYTCPVYRGQIERFNEIFAELHTQLDFLLIYISEAHPEDGWQVKINHTQDIVYTQPDRLEERAAIAADCIDRYGIPMPKAIDDMDNSLNKLYSGSPERLYLIDADGIVRHRSPPGPFKMSAIEAWYAALVG